MREELIEQPCLIHSYPACSLSLSFLRSHVWIPSLPLLAVEARCAQRRMQVTWDDTDGAQCMTDAMHVERGNETPARAVRAYLHISRFCLIIRSVAGEAATAMAT